MFFLVVFFFSFLASFPYRIWYCTQTNHNVSGSLNCFVVAVVAVVVVVVVVVVIVVVLVQFQIYIIKILKYIIICNLWLL